MRKSALLRLIIGTMVGIAVTGFVVNEPMLVATGMFSLWGIGTAMRR